MPATATVSTPALRGDATVAMGASLGIGFTTLGVLPTWARSKYTLGSAIAEVSLFNMSDAAGATTLLLGRGRPMCYTLRLPTLGLGAQSFARCASWSTAARLPPFYI